jgi:hypothetical protein
MHQWYHTQAYNYLVVDVWLHVSRRRGLENKICLVYICII